MSSWSWFHNLGVAAILVALGVIGWVIQDRQLALILILLLLLAAFIVIGLGITGRVSGAWIDERNKMTLSRLQLIVWTVLVLGGWLTLVLRNLATGANDPIAVAIPEQLWLLLGISTASLLGSPLILAGKRNQRVSTVEANETVQQLEGTSVTLEAAGPTSRQLVDSDTKQLRAVGAVEVRPRPEDASWADLFRGDETGNAAYVDVGKVQLFIFTAVLVLAYAISLFALFAGRDAVAALPALPESMLALLGISHAGYLTTKAVSHSAQE